MSVTFRRAACRESLLALAAQIATTVGLDPTAVSITLDQPRDVPLTTGNFDCLLIVGGESTWDDAFDGGGRVNDLRSRSIEVCCRSRSYSDVPHVDNTRLAGATFGHLAFEDAVYDAVQAFICVDGSGNALGCPTTIGTISKPQRLKQDEPGWVFSQFTATVLYEKSLDQSRI